MYLNPSFDSRFNARSCSLNTQLITIALLEHAMHIPYEYPYVGPQFDGQTYLTSLVPPCLLSDALTTLQCFPAARTR